MTGPPLCPPLFSLNSSVSQPRTAQVSSHLVFALVLGVLEGGAAGGARRDGLTSCCGLWALLDLQYYLDCHSSTGPMFAKVDDIGKNAIALEWMATHILGCDELHA